MIEEPAITSREVREIISKTWECLTLGLIDVRTASQVKRASRKVTGERRARIRGASSAELEFRPGTLAADIGDLRNADHMLNGLLASSGPQVGALDEAIDSALARAPLSIGAPSVTGGLLIMTNPVRCRTSC
jgi:hypothetical protein